MKNTLRSTLYLFSAATVFALPACHTMGNDKPESNKPGTTPMHGKPSTATSTDTTGEMKKM